MKPKPPRIYIIGPFRAATEFGRRANIARAEKLALQVAATGAHFFCPHTHTAHFDGMLPDDYWIELGMSWLAECAAAVLVPDSPDGPQIEGGAGPQRLYLLPGVALHGSRYASHGSIAEVAWCKDNGRPVLANLVDLCRFVDAWNAERRTP